MSKQRQVRRDWWSLTPSIYSEIQKPSTQRTSQYPADWSASDIFNYIYTNTKGQQKENMEWELQKATGAELASGMTNQMIRSMQSLPTPLQNIDEWRQTKQASEQKAAIEHAGKGAFGRLTDILGITKPSTLTMSEFQQQRLEEITKPAGDQFEKDLTKMFIAPQGSGPMSRYQAQETDTTAPDYDDIKAHINEIRPSDLRSLIEARQALNQISQSGTVVKPYTDSQMFDSMYRKFINSITLIGDLDPLAEIKPWMTNLDDLQQMQKEYPWVGDLSLVNKVAVEDIKKRYSYETSMGGILADEFASLAGQLPWLKSVVGGLTKGLMSMKAITPGAKFIQRHAGLFGTTGGFMAIGLPGSVMRQVREAELLKMIKDGTQKETSLIGQVWNVTSDLFTSGVTGALLHGSSTAVNRLARVITGSSLKNSGLNPLQKIDRQLLFTNVYAKLVSAPVAAHLITDVQYILHPGEIREQEIHLRNILKSLYPDMSEAELDEKVSTVDFRRQLATAMIFLSMDLVTGGRQYRETKGKLHEKFAEIKKILTKPSVEETIKVNVPPLVTTIEHLNNIENHVNGVNDILKRSGIEVSETPDKQKEIIKEQLKNANIMGQRSLDNVSDEEQGAIIHGTVLKNAIGEVKTDVDFIKAIKDIVPELTDEEKVTYGTEDLLNTINRGEVGGITELHAGIPPGEFKKSVEGIVEGLTNLILPKSVEGEVRKNYGIIRDHLLFKNMDITKMSVNKVFQIFNTLRRGATNIPDDVWQGMYKYASIVCPKEIGSDLDVRVSPIVNETGNRDADKSTLLEEKDIKALYKNFGEEFENLTGTDMGFTFKRFISNNTIESKYRIGGEVMLMKDIQAVSIDDWVDLNMKRLGSNLPNLTQEEQSEMRHYYRKMHDVYSSKQETPTAKVTFTADSFINWPSMQILPGIGIRTPSLIDKIVDKINRAMAFGSNSALRWQILPMERATVARYGIIHNDSQGKIMMSEGEFYDNLERNDYNIDPIFRKPYRMTDTGPVHERGVYEKVKPGDEFDNNAQYFKRRIVDGSIKDVINGFNMEPLAFFTSMVTQDLLIIPKNNGNDVICLRIPGLSSMMTKGRDGGLYAFDTGAWINKPGDKSVPVSGYLRSDVIDQRINPVIKEFVELVGNFPDSATMFGNRINVLGEDMTVKDFLNRFYAGIMVDQGGKIKFRDEFTKEDVKNKLDLINNSIEHVNALKLARNEERKLVQVKLPVSPLVPQTQEEALLVAAQRSTSQPTLGDKIGDIPSKGVSPIPAEVLVTGNDIILRMAYMSKLSKFYATAYNNAEVIENDPQSLIRATQRLNRDLMSAAQMNKYAAILQRDEKPANPSRVATVLNNNHFLPGISLDRETGKAIIKMVVIDHRAIAGLDPVVEGIEPVTGVNLGWLVKHLQRQFVGADGKSKNDGSVLLPSHRSGSKEYTYSGLLNDIYDLGDGGSVKALITDSNLGIKAAFHSITANDYLSKRAKDAGIGMIVDNSTNKIPFTGKVWNGIEPITKDHVVTTDLDNFILQQDRSRIPKSTAGTQNAFLSTDTYNPLLQELLDPIAREIKNPDGTPAFNGINGLLDTILENKKQQVTADYTNLLKMFEADPQQFIDWTVKFLENIPYSVADISYLKKLRGHPGAGQQPEIATYLKENILRKIIKAKIDMAEYGTNAIAIPSDHYRDIRGIFRLVIKDYIHENIEAGKGAPLGDVETIVDRLANGYLAAEEQGKEFSGTQSWEKEIVSHSMEIMGKVFDKNGDIKAGYAGIGGDIIKEFNLRPSRYLDNNNKNLYNRIFTKKTPANNMNFTGSDLIFADYGKDHNNGITGNDYEFRNLKDSDYDIDILSLWLNDRDSGQMHAWGSINGKPLYDHLWETMHVKRAHLMDIYKNTQRIDNAAKFAELASVLGFQPNEQSLDAHIPAIVNGVSYRKDNTFNAWNFNEMVKHFYKNDTGRVINTNKIVNMLIAGGFKMSLPYMIPEMDMDGKLTIRDLGKFEFGSFDPKRLQEFYETFANILMWATDPKLGAWPFDITGLQSRLLYGLLHTFTPTEGYNELISSKKFQLTDMIYQNLMRNVLAGMKEIMFRPALDLFADREAGEKMTYNDYIRKFNEYKNTKLILNDRMQLEQRVDEMLDDILVTRRFADKLAGTEHFKEKGSIDILKQHLKKSIMESFKFDMDRAPALGILNGLTADSTPHYAPDEDYQIRLRDTVYNAMLHDQISANPNTAPLLGDESFMGKLRDVMYTGLHIYDKAKNHFFSIGGVQDPLLRNYFTDKMFDLSRFQFKELTSNILRTFIKRDVNGKWVTDQAKLTALRHITRSDAAVTAIVNYYSNMKNKTTPMVGGVGRESLVILPFMKEHPWLGFADGRNSDEFWDLKTGQCLIEEGEPVGIRFQYDEKGVETPEFWGRDKMKLFFQKSGDVTYTYKEPFGGTREYTEAELAKLPSDERARIKLNFEKRADTGNRYGYEKWFGQEPGRTVLLEWLLRPTESREDKMLEISQLLSDKGLNNTSLTLGRTDSELRKNVALLHILDPQNYYKEIDQKFGINVTGAQIVDKIDPDMLNRFYNHIDQLSTTPDQVTPSGNESAVKHTAIELLRESGTRMTGDELQFSLGLPILLGAGFVAAYGAGKAIVKIFNNTRNYKAANPRAEIKRERTRGFIFNRSYKIITDIANATDENQRSQLIEGLVNKLEDLVGKNDAIDLLASTLITMSKNKTDKVTMAAYCDTLLNTIQAINNAADSMNWWSKIPKKVAASILSPAMMIRDFEKVQYTDLAEDMMFRVPVVDLTKPPLAADRVTYQDVTYADFMLNWADQPNAPGARVIYGNGSQGQMLIQTFTDIFNSFKNFSHAFLDYSNVRASDRYSGMLAEIMTSKAMASIDAGGFVDAEKYSYLKHTDRNGKVDLSEILPFPHGEGGLSISLQEQTKETHRAAKEGHDNRKNAKRVVDLIDKDNPGLMDKFATDHNTSSQTVKKVFETGVMLQYLNKHILKVALQQYRAQIEQIAIKFAEKGVPVSSDILDEFDRNTYNYINSTSASSFLPLYFKSDIERNEFFTNKAIGAVYDVIDIYKKDPESMDSQDLIATFNDITSGRVDGGELRRINDRYELTMKGLDGKNYVPSNTAIFNHILKNVKGIYNLTNDDLAFLVSNDKEAGKKLLLDKVKKDFIGSAFEDTVSAGRFGLSKKLSSNSLWRTIGDIKDQPIRKDILIWDDFIDDTFNSLNRKMVNLIAQKTDELFKLHGCNSLERELFLNYAKMESGQTRTFSKSTPASKLKPGDCFQVPIVTNDKNNIDWVTGIVKDVDSKSLTYSTTPDMKNIKVVEHNNANVNISRSGDIVRDITHKFAQLIAKGDPKQMDEIERSIPAQIVPGALGIARDVIIMSTLGGPRFIGYLRNNLLNANVGYTYGMRALGSYVKAIVNVPNKELAEYAALLKKQESSNALINFLDSAANMSGGLFELKHGILKLGQAFQRDPGILDTKEKRSRAPEVVRALGSVLHNTVELITKGMLGFGYSTKAEGYQREKLASTLGARQMAGDYYSAFTNMTAMSTAIAWTTSIYTPEFKSWNTATLLGRIMHMFWTYRIGMVGKWETMIKQNLRENSQLILNGVDSFEKVILDKYGKIGETRVDPNLIPSIVPDKDGNATIRYTNNWTRALKRHMLGGISTGVMLALLFDIAKKGISYELMDAMLGNNASHKVAKTLRDIFTFKLLGLNVTGVGNIPETSGDPFIAAAMPTVNALLELPRAEINVETVKSGKKKGEQYITSDMLEAMNELFMETMPGFYIQKAVNSLFLTGAAVATTGTKSELLRKEAEWQAGLSNTPAGWLRKRSGNRAFATSAPFSIADLIRPGFILKPMPKYISREIESIQTKEEKAQKEIEKWMQIY